MTRTRLRRTPGTPQRYAPWPEHRRGADGASTPPLDIEERLISQRE